MIVNRKIKRLERSRLDYRNIGILQEKYFISTKLIKIQLTVYVSRIKKKCYLSVNRLLLIEQVCLKLHVRLSLNNFFLVSEFRVIISANLVFYKTIRVLPFFLNNSTDTLTSSHETL